MCKNARILDPLYDNKINFRFVIFPIVFLLGLFFLMSFTVTAALSTKTTQTIQGTKPYIQLVDQNGVVTGHLITLEQLLGFTMPDGSGGIIQKDSRDSITSGGTEISHPDGMKFSDVVTLVAADGVAHNITNGADDDGDTPTVAGSMTATWKDGRRNIITDLNSFLVECDGPYDLMIGANDVSVETTYGDPRINAYGSQTPIKYTFQSSGLPKFCYIMTGSPSVFRTTGEPGVNSKYPATGYNPAVWKAFLGFSVEKLHQLGVAYPTTGFNKATLKFQPSGIKASNRNNYRCTTTSSWITLSANGLANDCTATYNTISKPTTPAVINLEYLRDGTWVKADSYTIPVPTKWAIAKGEYAYANSTPIESATAFPAASMCKDDTTTSVTTAAEAATYLWKPEELTNAPSASVVSSSPSSWDPNKNEYFVRDVDGTFSGEWGSLSSNYYPGSNLESNDASFTWTNAAGSNNYLHFAYSQYAGEMFSYDADEPLTTICK